VLTFSPQLRIFSGSLPFSLFSSLKVGFLPLTAVPLIDDRLSTINSSMHAHTRAPPNLFLYQLLSTQPGLSISPCLLRAGSAFLQNLNLDLRRFRVPHFLQHQQPVRGIKTSNFPHSLCCPRFAVLLTPRLTTSDSGSYASSSSNSPASTLSPLVSLSNPTSHRSSLGSEPNSKKGWSGVAGSRSSGGVSSLDTTSTKDLKGMVRLCASTSATRKSIFWRKKISD
jgi:hypothetical protein